MEQMKYVALFALILVVGCKPPEVKPDPKVATPPAGVSSDDVRPIGGVAAGGMTPMQGGQNLGSGTGGGIASAAKGQARKAGGAMSGGSAAQLSGE